LKKVEDSAYDTLLIELAFLLPPDSDIHVHTVGVALSRYIDAVRATCRAEMPALQAEIDNIQKSAEILTQLASAFEQACARSMESPVVDGHSADDPLAPSDVRVSGVPTPGQSPV
jgi:hypothetical protein